MDFKIKKITVKDSREMKNEVEQLKKSKCSKPEPRRDS